jgi:translocation and assembly module TamA
MKLIAFIILMIFSTISLADEKYCPGVILSGEKIKFTETERKLFCGDSSSHAWKDIPAYQAQESLRAFLQARAYLEPSFEVKNGVLYVHKGHHSTVKDLEVISTNKNLGQKIKHDVFRLYHRRELTTAMLNSIEGEGMAQLRKRGYPCATVKSQVDVTTDTVTLILDPKTKHKFGVIKREPVEGLNPRALERFYPMTAGQRFNGDLLDLTEKRIERSGVLQGTYFLESCTDDGKTYSLEQKFLTGPPRTIRFGAGASTESGPMARVLWSNNRAGSMASLLSATLQASFRVQSLNLAADYFAWPDNPRRSFYGQVEVTRESQFKYEQFITRVRPQMKWTKDVQQHGMTFIAGPAYENGTFHSQDKSETRTFSTGVLEASLLRTSNDYELFDIHPQGGDQQGITFAYRSPLLGFNQALTKIDTTFVKLGRITNSGRGALIGGVRLKAGTSFVRSTTDLSLLPPEVKFFGGGSDDLRGYLLRTLPRNNGAGALSRFIGKFELRQTHFLHEKVEAFGFADAGYFGEKSFSLLPKLWYSPGVGVRWLSPIGIVQGYVARALAIAPAEDSGNFYYAGLGGTF